MHVLLKANLILSSYFLFLPRSSYEDFFALAASLAIFSFLAMAASTPIPPKTRPTPSNCICVRRWPNATTERIMVNILRVTVTRSTEEKVERV